MYSHLDELSELVDQQRNSCMDDRYLSAAPSIGAAGAIHGQHLLSDDLANAYIQRSSKASSYYASKKQSKSK